MGDFPTPQLDKEIEKLGNTPALITKLGHHFTGKRLNLKHYNGVVLQEAALKAFLMAQRDLARKGSNKRILVNSSYRSWTQQAALYARYKSGISKLPAAPPGHSYHNIGLALDIGNWGDKDVRAALTRHGWNWLGTKDVVHYSYKVHG